jgi:hypothetical protein
MSGISLARLRGMSRDEMSWRIRQTARTAVSRMAVRVRPPRWHRRELRRVLRDGVLAHRLHRDSDAAWQAVHAELSRHIANRASRFTLDPTSAGEMRDAILARWPDAATEAATRADDILAGRYDVLGYRQLSWGSPDDSVDWHLDPVSGRRPPLRFWADVPYLDPAVGDHKVIWELNRHQHWLQLGRALWLTGDPRYRRGMIEQLQSWLEANPPLVGINWASMLEIALRTISWMWGLHFLLAHDGIRDPDSPWLVDMLVALDRQLAHVEQNLSVYFSPNTHLTGEALGLYVAGVALPELAGSARWRATGRRILIEEIGRQIYTDGGHAERSTHYQRYTLDFYLLALLTAERGGDDEAVAIFRDAATRLAEFTRAMADDGGRLPLIGDDDGGMLWRIGGRACHDVRDSLSLAAVLLDRPDLAPWGLQEEVVWIAGPRALSHRSRHELPSDASASVPSRAFADSGFVVLRDPSGSHATFSAGRHGYLNGGHAHADALSMTLTLRGRPLLVDCGTSTYTMNARRRNLLRSSMSHNTVTLDDRSQAVPHGAFHWRSRADARLLGWRGNDGFDWAEAWHDGYSPARHRRTLVRTARGEWLMADEILGQGRVAARAHWHFDPDWKLEYEAPGRLLASHEDGMDAWLLFDAGEVLFAHGDDESGLGWYAPVYGTLVPTWTARMTRIGDAPLLLLTWIRETCAARCPAPSLERVSPACDAQAPAIGARVAESDSSSVFLLQPGESPARGHRGCGILDYHTNARVLHYAEAGGHFVALDMIDGSHALTHREGWVSIAASEPIADLHAALSAGVLDLHSSAPPPELRFHGRALCGVRQLRLNRRPIDLPASDRQGPIAVYGADWAPTVQSLTDECLATSLSMSLPIADPRLTNVEEWRLPVDELIGD